VPLAYLTHRAFFAGLELYVDERVLVPRSPIAELIAARFAPWIASRGVRRILDVGTGSGAIALACAQAFPRARVDAVDISPGALAVTRRNVRRLKLGKRVKVLRSNHFAAVPPCRYHIIVSNPPYVGRSEMRRLPREYAFEPRIALASGNDGLDSVRAIFAAAPRYLADDGHPGRGGRKHGAGAHARVPAIALHLAGDRDGRRRGVHIAGGRLEGEISAWLEIRSDGCSR
jgi:ribosomal protein L3 glutamine methyltransferase